MYRPPHEWHYVIFYNQNSKDRSSPLLRMTDCKLSSRKLQVFVETNNGDQTYELKNVRDFVSAMF